MNGIGLREVVALAALVVAIGISAMFLDPSASESKAPPPSMLLLSSPPSQSAPVTTATPVAPAHQLQQPADGWYTEFFDARDGGEGSVTGQGFLEDLDLEFEGSPFPDVRDDLWYVRSTARLEVPDGRSEFTLEHRGSVSVLVDGKEAAQQAGGEDARTLTVSFEHEAGRAEISIEGRDTGGPFFLKWK